MNSIETEARDFGANSVNAASCYVRKKLVSFHDDTLVNPETYGHGLIRLEIVRITFHKRENTDENNE